jgi:uncharacterized protein YbjQ (UPF0145 family)
MMSPAVAARLGAVLIAFAAALPAQARNVALLRPVPEALAAPGSREIVGELALRFGAASAAGLDIVERDLVAQGVAGAANDMGRGGSGRESDETVCLHAFQDALARLAAAARRANAGAIVGVVSYDRRHERDALLNYECHAGSFRASVTLKAQLAHRAPPATGLVAATSFAAFDDVAAVPLGEAGRERYAHFLTLPKPRAFVVHEDGAWRFWSADPEATAKALDYCGSRMRRCWLYAVDDRVVWAADVDRRIGGGDRTEPGAAHEDEHQ